VHATHVTGDDVSTLGGTGTSVCACPSTEADLADGVGPFRRLRDAGSPLCLGSDQHAQTDLLAEARLMEAAERLTTGKRGRFRPAELVDALTVAGHRALGWPDAGRIAAGRRADLVAVRLDSPRTAGCAPDQLVLAAGAADVHTVVVDGRVVVSGGQHVLGDVGRLLAAAIEPLWEKA
jgi:cytosine/adenosine deaminase-related metal-dependent hydrolase